MKKLFDAKCTACGEITEVFGKADDEFRCGTCHSPAKRIITPVRCHLPGNDPTGFPGAAMKWAKDHQKHGNKP